MASLLPCLALALLFTSFVRAATYVVNSVGDEPDDNLPDGTCHTSAGTCTLRAAIQEANANRTPTQDEIAFNIPGPGVHTISPLTNLPVVTAAVGVVIDGYSQPGSSPNTLVVGSNAVLQIEIAGAHAGPGAVGLVLASRLNGVTGLVVNQFDLGIWIQAGLGNQVSGCFIGTDASGATARSNRVGILVQASGDMSSPPFSTMIGGNYPESRNVVSGNAQAGIVLGSGAESTDVLGNYVGTNSAGTAALPNAQNGIRIESGPAAVLISGNVVSGNGDAGVSIFSAQGSILDGNLIGTDAAGEAPVPNGDGVEVETAASNFIGSSGLPRNVISGNTRHGIRILSQSTGNVVQNNFIGTNRAGALAVGNGGSGISISLSSSGNLIGGQAFNAGNRIAFNGGSGVVVGSDSSDLCVGNVIFANSMHDNGVLGIDLGGDGPTPNDPCDADAGPNNLQNSPVLTMASSSAGSTTIQGTLNSTASTESLIEFFANASCDPSGRGEGQISLGSTPVTTDGSCNASFDVTLPVSVPAGFVITATASDQNANTSEFSACVTIQVPERPRPIRVPRKLPPPRTVAPRP